MKAAKIISALLAVGLIAFSAYKLFFQEKEVEEEEMEEKGEISTVSDIKKSFPAVEVNKNKAAQSYKVTGNYKVKR